MNNNQEQIRSDNSDDPLGVKMLIHTLLFITLPIRIPFQVLMVIFSSKKPGGKATGPMMIKQMLLAILTLFILAYIALICTTAAGEHFFRDATTQDGFGHIYRELELPDNYAPLWFGLHAFTFISLIAYLSAFPGVDRVVGREKILMATLRPSDGYIGINMDDEELKEMIYGRVYANRNLSHKELSMGEKNVNRMSDTERQGYHSENAFKSFGNINNRLDGKELTREKFVRSENFMGFIDFADDETLYEVKSSQHAGIAGGLIKNKFRFQLLTYMYVAERDKGQVVVFDEHAKHKRTHTLYAEKEKSLLDEIKTIDETISQIKAELLAMSTGEIQRLTRKAYDDSSMRVDRLENEWYASMPSYR